MAGRLFVEPIVGGHVIVGIAQPDVGRADIWRHHRKADEAPPARSDVAFFGAADAADVFVTNDPLLREDIAANDQIWRGRLGRRAAVSAGQEYENEADPRVNRDNGALGCESVLYQLNLLRWGAIGDDY